MKDRQTRALGVAVVGAGYWGKNLIRNFRSHKQFELKYVVDRPNAVDFEPSNGEQFIFDLHTAFEDKAVEVVAISTPPESHEEIALLAINAKKHVLIEKPLATSVEAGKRIVEAARTAGVVLMCDHTYCYSPAVQMIRDMVLANELGEILFIDSVRINLGLIQREADVIWDLAPHDLSILDYILPDEMKAKTLSATATDPLNLGTNCIGYLNIGLKTNVDAHIHVNWLSPTKVRKFVIGGSRKMLVWDDLDPNQRLTLIDKGVSITKDQLNGEERMKALVGYRSGGLESPALQEVESLKLVLDELASSIIQERTPRTDGESGLRVVELLELASRSVEAGGSPQQVV